MAENKVSRKVRSFSLNEEDDKDILDKLSNVPNISDYIKKLIREDIDKRSALTDAQRKEIEDIVMNIIKDKALVSKEEELAFDEDAIDALSQFDDL